MPIEWEQWCRQGKFAYADDTIEVRFPNGRTHRVKVEDQGENILLTSVVIRQAMVREMDDPCIEAWQRNRAVALVGFRVDNRGRLVGQTCIPKHGITGDEFILLVDHLASECDRFEYQLTGQDRE